MLLPWSPIVSDATTFFDDVEALGFEASLLDELVDVNRQRLRTDPAFAIAVMLGHYRLGTMVHFCATAARTREPT